MTQLQCDPGNTSLDFSRSNIRKFPLLKGHNLSKVSHSGSAWGWQWVPPLAIVKFTNHHGKEYISQINKKNLDVLSFRELQVTDFPSLSSRQADCKQGVREVRKGLLTSKGGGAAPALPCCSRMSLPQGPPEICS